MYIRISLGFLIYKSYTSLCYGCVEAAPIYLLYRMSSEPAQSLLKKYYGTSWSTKWTCLCKIYALISYVQWGDHFEINPTHVWQYDKGSICMAQQNSPNPECMVNVSSAMMIGFEWFIYWLIYLFIKDVAHASGIVILDLCIALIVNWMMKIVSWKCTTGIITITGKWLPIGLRHWSLWMLFLVIFCREVIHLST